MIDPAFFTTGLDFTWGDTLTKSRHQWVFKGKWQLLGERDTGRCGGERPGNFTLWMWQLRLHMCRRVGVAVSCPKNNQWDVPVCVSTLSHTIAQSRWPRRLYTLVYTSALSLNSHLVKMLRLEMYHKVEIVMRKVIKTNKQTNAKPQKAKCGNWQPCGELDPLCIVGESIGGHSHYEIYYDSSWKI